MKFTVDKKKQKLGVKSAVRFSVGDWDYEEGQIWKILSHLTWTLSFCATLDSYDLFFVA